MSWFHKMKDLVMDLFPSEKRALSSPSSPENYNLLVKQAWQEWQEARQRFDQVSDPAMVDYAVYSLQAAERRYIYLLQKARRRAAQGEYESSPLE